MLTRLHALPFVAGYIVALLLLSACGGPQISLTGTVIDAYTGKPVSSANLALGRNQRITDAGGTYEFPSWRDQDTLKITAVGYEPLSIALDSQPQLAQATPPSVKLNPTLRPNTLAGMLTDSYTGLPLAHARISAGGAISTTSDIDGRYTLSGVAETFTLTISAQGYESRSEPMVRQTHFDAVVRPNTLSGIVKDSFSGKPLLGASVAIGDIAVPTNAEGYYYIAGVPENATVQINAAGYAVLTQPIEKATTIDAALRPDILRGTLLDAVSGAPITDATIIATPTTNSADVAYTRIDNSVDGTFKLDGLPEHGFLQVLAPGYRKAVIEVKPEGIDEPIKLEPFQAKALYMKTSVASQGMEVVDTYFDLIDRTELNALVLDLKSDNLGDLGLIYYDSQLPIVKELGLSKPYMDLTALLAEARRRNIYTIARIHIFAHDNLLAETRPEWAAHDTRGCKPNENRLCHGPIFYADWDIAWLDPWNEQVWDYNIALATEAAQLGFDEINFDYIRFPNDGRTEYMQLSKPVDWHNNAQAMYDAIGHFMEKAQRAINGSGAFFSADVFGYAAWTPQPNIGQNIAIMGQHADYICPMVYPSHFVFGEMGFDDPATHPYEIVAESLKRGEALIGAGRARLRPWLQDFTLLWRPPIVKYGDAEVRAQIDASESLPTSAGWMLWDSDNDYTEGALKHEQ